LRGIFDLFKNILLQPSRTYFQFYKNGFLNSQVVRIRVKVVFKIIIQLTQLIGAIKTLWINPDDKGVQDSPSNCTRLFSSRKVACAKNLANMI
jgi:hypothetical protein